MPWGKKWPVQMNLLFFAVKAYVPGGGPESGRQKFEKCLPAGTGTNIYFSSVKLSLSTPIVVPSYCVDKDLDINSNDVWLHALTGASVQKMFAQDYVQNISLLNSYF